MKKLQKFALIYLLALGFAAWGYSIGEFHVWPYSLLQEIHDFVEGDPEEKKTTLTEKILNDSNLHPSRSLVKYDPGKRRPYRELTIPGKSARRDQAKIYTSERAPAGYRLIYGSFDFEEGRHGALLLDKNWQVVHTWILHERDMSFKMKNPEERKFPHGFKILPDGSVLFAFDFGISIQRFDWCGNRLWATRSGIDHSIEPDGEGTVWSVGYPDFISRFNLASGKRLRNFKIHKFMGANPSIDILGLRQNDYNNRWTWAKGKGGPWHPNDVEPLLPEMADAFPQFEAGDLLISLRSINLIYVADPKTLKIKWWRMGSWRRQHDPDWQPDGTITVYDNNMHRGVSRIVQIDPKDYSTRILFDGRRENFYTWMRGKHQVLENGNILITSPQQGRVFEVTPGGEVVFEFLNVYNQETHEMLLVSEAVYLPEDFFSFDKPPVCSE